MITSGFDACLNYTVRINLLCISMPVADIALDGLWSFGWSISSRDRNDKTGDFPNVGSKSFLTCVLSETSEFQRDC